jgi:hypothetical protein
MDDSIWATKNIHHYTLYNHYSRLSGVFLLSFTHLVSLDRKIAVMSRDLHYVFLISGPFTDYNACLVTVFSPLRR